MRYERLLITGGGGQLASDLEQRLGADCELAVLPRTRLDVTDEHEVESVFAEFRPDLAVNCAAFHNVDLCESEPERSFAVNATAVARLARRCGRAGAGLVHLSTNYVFDGGRPAPYQEDDSPRPRSVYAISKLAGEHAARAYLPEALVVRSAGLYGLHGSGQKGGNFVTRILARAREQGELRVVADQRLTPTFTGDLAEALIDALQADARGLLHLTNSGECSWYEFAGEIVSLAGVEVPIHPLETAPKEGAADRPLNGVLASQRADALGLSPLRPWREALADYMQRAGLAAVSA